MTGSSAALSNRQTTVGEGSLRGEPGTTAQENRRCHVGARERRRRGGVEVGVEVASSRFQRQQRKVVAAASVPSPAARRPWAELERALCAVLCAAGLRVSEVVALNVGDVHRSPTELARLHVGGKADRGRTVPFPPEALAAVDAYLQSRSHRLGRHSALDRLFVRADGGPFTRRVVDHLVPGWFPRAGVAPPPGALGPRPAPHLRHLAGRPLRDPARGPGPPRPCQPGHHPGLPGGDGPRRRAHRHGQPGAPTAAGTERVRCAGAAEDRPPQRRTSGCHRLPRRSPDGVSPAGLAQAEDRAPGGP